MKKYNHLLSPIQFGNVIAKNRLGMSRAIPTFVSGVEDSKPFESMITFAGDMAANGAAIVPLPAIGRNNPHSRDSRMPMPPELDDADEDDKPKPDKGLPAPHGIKGIDLTIRNNRILFARAVAAVHNHSSLASLGVSEVEPMGWNISEIPLEYLEELPERFAAACVDFQSMGIDVCNVHMSYGGTLLCNSISPRNQRTDKYGGKNIIERSTLSLNVFRRIKEVCPDIILQVQISGEEPAGGYTLDELCEYARLCDGIVDIFQIRGATDSAAHPTGINSKKGSPVTLRYAERLKKLGTSIVMAPVGGYGDPELNEKWLAEGKCDMIYMSRAFMAEPDYIKKILQNEAKDIVPCLLCNKCHCRPGDPEFGCSVNPQLALSVDPNFSKHIMIKPKPKKVAVIGGGPAGMEAAIIASRRGHDVTLYEKSQTLGGQLLHADYPAFKWPLRDFKNYLISQLAKTGTRVLTGTPATPGLLAKENYDAILMATGAREKMPEIEGILNTRVWNPLSVYGHVDELGAKVVVIGGSETGTETAWYLAMCGKQVIQVSRSMPDAFNQTAGQYRERLAAEGSGGSLTSIMRVTTTAVSDGKVRISSRKDGERELSCDDIVACGGVYPVQEQIDEYASICHELRVIGDCRKPRDVRVAMKDAYTAAILL